MKITKFAHCSLLVDTGKARILFDPGIYSGDLSSATDLDAVIITHQHGDHLDIDQLLAVINQNQEVAIITHEGPSQQLKQANLDHQLLDSGQSTIVGDSQVLAFDAPHESIYQKRGLVPNLGFVIDGQFCFSGDSFHTPPANQKPKVLALPVVAPWLKIAEAIDYAIKVSPQICIPVHDGFLSQAGPFYNWPAQILSEHGIEFTQLENGATIEI